MNALAQVRKGINTVLSYACGLVFALMVCVATYQVVARYVFNSPSTISEELLTYSFTWMALLSAALVFGKRDHMRMGFVADKLTGTGKLILEIAIEGLVMVMAASIMIFGGCSIVRLTLSQKSASLGIPMGVIYAIIPVVGILIFAYSILNIIDLYNGTEREQREVKE